MIKLKLNEKYKSFDDGFETELDGSLIILSGINGSGKSQLMNIIYGGVVKSPYDDLIVQDGVNKRDINRSILLKGQSINKNNIELRSFKNNILMPEVVKADSSKFNQSANQAFDYYKKNSFNLENYFNEEFSQSIEKIQRLLKKEYGSKIDNLREDEFKRVLIEARFEWKHNDSFSDIIGNIFYDHATKIAQGQQEVGKIGGDAFDLLSLGKAPWDELNELFETLQLDYRFKDNYETKYGELLEIPILYQIDCKMQIIEEEKRLLQDLSEGEKAIISLCFTSISKMDVDDKKLLLLDEFDATLNPSLIEALFEVINKYFIEKGIVVVMATHSSATISLAPEYTSYYEVFKNNLSPVRIFKVDRDSYSELQKVNKDFYDKLKNQDERIKELEASIDSKEDILIITEGKTDWKYILRALKHFHAQEEFLDVKQEYFYRFGSKDDVGNSICGTNVFADMGESQLKSFLSAEINIRVADREKRRKLRIGVFDSDTNTVVKSKEEYGVFSFKITPDNISTEFLFTEDDLKIDVQGERLYVGEEFNERTTRHNDSNLTLGIGSSKRAGKREIIDFDVFDENGINKALSKEKFAQAIYNDEIKVSEESWENFRHIFENISSYLLIKSDNKTDCEVEKSLL